MSEPTVRFPVTCPKCGRERLTELSVDVVADALQKGSDISLVATCHDMIWTATELELEQIQEYLGAVHPGLCSFSGHMKLVPELDNDEINQ
jgi:hypothetical protein